MVNCDLLILVSLSCRPIILPIESPDSTIRRERLSNCYSTTFPPPHIYGGHVLVYISAILPITASIARSISGPPTTRQLGP